MGSINRRDFIKNSTLTVGAVVVSGCSGENEMELYKESAEKTRLAISKDSNLREMIRYATLAANGHNTQPWKFQIDKSNVRILPDFTRQTPVVDPDDHHLFASLGCASENFAITAEALGKPAEIIFNSQDHGEIFIDLGNGNSNESELFNAIPYRQCTRSEYNGKKVSASDLKLLEQAARVEGISLILITEKEPMERVLEYVIVGNSAQIDDPAFVKELKQWIRFNPTQALDDKDGLFSGCSGNPSMPTWVGNLIFRYVFTKGSSNDGYSKQIRSSAGIAIFVSEKNDKEHWVNAGRSYQRFALQATALGMRHSFINQPIEVAQIRPEFAKWLGVGNNRPDLVVRFGYAPALPMSLRRPVEDVLI